MHILVSTCAQLRSSKATPLAPGRVAMESEEARSRRLADIAERFAKRARIVYSVNGAQPDAGSSLAPASSAALDDAGKAHLSWMIGSEYQDAKQLPEVIRAQQGGGPAAAGAASAPGGKGTASSHAADLIEQLESKQGRALSNETASSRDPAAGAVALRSAYSSKPQSASNLKSALVTPEEARASREHGGDQSMLNSALIRKKEMAAQQAKPQHHPNWKLMRVISGHLGWVRCMAVEPNNQWFATGAGDRMIKIWDLASGELKLSLTGHISTVRGLAVSPRHPYMFSAGEDKLVKCWDLETNKVIRQYYGHLSGIYALAQHPVLDVIVSAGRDASARVWDMRTKAQIHVLGGHRGTVASVQCQESDPQVITGSMDSTVKLWDLAAGRSMTTLTHHKKSVRALALHPQEFTFVSGSAGGRNVKKWRCPEGTLLNNMTHEGIVNTLSVNSDGVLFSGADDGSMRFFDYKTGVPFQDMGDIVQPGSLDAEAGIFCSSFDQTGTRLLTGGADKSAYAASAAHCTDQHSDQGVPGGVDDVDHVNTSAAKPAATLGGGLCTEHQRVQCRGLQRLVGSSCSLISSVHLNWMGLRSSSSRSTLWARCVAVWPAACRARWI